MRADRAGSTAGISVSGQAPLGIHHEGDGVGGEASEPASNLQAAGVQALTGDGEPLSTRGSTRPLRRDAATPPPRLDSLTGLRFVAALAVFGLHALNYGGGAPGEALLIAGTTGVSFFFIVSGFVMSWTARDDDTAVLFYRRRFARIYPAYAVTWVLSLVATMAAGRQVSLLDGVPLTLLQSWVPSENVYWATNAVFWTLSCEAFFYIAFPWMYRVVRSWTARQALLGIVVLVVAVELLALAVWGAGGGPVLHWLAVVFPVTRAAEFAVGVLLGVLAARGVRWSPQLGAAVAVAGGAFLLADHVPAAFRDVAVTLVPFALLIWSAAHADLTSRRSVFRARPFAALGTWSYAFYLVHSLVMMAGFEALHRSGIVLSSPSGSQWLLAVCGILGCAVAAAWCLHTFVEVPMEKRLRPRRMTAPAKT
ncbi:acyltransferase family protein [Modestobacter altitudinis]|uniref:acyltransferase family protein n=1 Tax=Modestobacter altitudinis TaxID=2213158 RepID=UPI00110CC03D|nr:acyltransferase [Modestobacter altitudinis]